MAVTWSPSAKFSSIVLSNGNKTATTNLSATDACVRASGQPSTAKSYCEILVDANTTPWGGVGYCDEGFDVTSATPFSTVTRINSRTDAGGTYIDGSFIGSSPNPAATNVIMLALDDTGSKYYIGLNGTWLDSGDPSTNTNGMAVTFAGGTQRFVFGYFRETDQQLTLRTTAAEFSYPIPTGFSAYDTSAAPADQPPGAEDQSAESARALSALGWAALENNAGATQHPRVVLGTPEISIGGLWDNAVYEPGLYAQFVQGFSSLDLAGVGNGIFEDAVTLADLLQADDAPEPSIFAAVMAPWYADYLGDQGPLSDDAPVTTTITVVAGSIVYAGQAITVNAVRAVPVVSASVTYAGQTIAVNAKKAVAVVAAGIAYAGQTVTVNARKAVAVLPGSIVYAGQAVIVNAKKAVAVVAGAIVYAGQSITVTNSGGAPTTISVVAASIVYAGKATVVNTRTAVAVVAAGISYAGQATVVNAKRLIQVLPGAITYAGQFVSIGGAGIYKAWRRLSYLLGFRY